jgi:hypothetical protein
VIGGEQQQQRAEILRRRERKFPRSRVATAQPRTEDPARGGRSDARECRSHYGRGRRQKTTL